MPDVTVRLEKFVCTAQGDGSKDGDDLYIKYIIDSNAIDQRFPAGDSVGISDIKPNQEWRLDFPISFKNTLVVSLHDKDTGDNDFLGSATYTKDDDLPGSPRLFEQRKGHYELYARWE